MCVCECVSVSVSVYVRLLTYLQFPLPQELLQISPILEALVSHHHGATHEHHKVTL